MAVREEPAAPAARVRWFSGRSLLLHLAVVVWVPGCAVAAWWQVTIAMAGNGLGWLYAVEWPVFAVLGVLGWWQLVHDDPAAVAERRRARRRPPVHEPAASELAAGPAGEGSAATAPQPEPEPAPLAPALTPANIAEIAAAEARDEGLAAYNAYLASLAVMGRRKTWRDPTGERAGADT